MRTTNSHQLTAWGIFLAIIGGYFLMATKFPLAYIMATYEDLIGEWTQVFLFAATLLLATRLALTKAKHRWFFGVLALACFYVVGEEISWGQRIFDIPTPEFFRTHNQQNETNLHNFFTGPIKSKSKLLLEYLIATGLVTYGLLYPLLVKLRIKFALWFCHQGLPFPPLYLWPFFVASAFLELGILKFNEAEIAEILIPLALAIMALNYLQAERKKQPLNDILKWDRQSSKQLAGWTLATVAAVILLGVGATAACYSSPRLKPGIEDRYLNGIEKFAGRYKRQENWAIAAKLFAMVHQQEPDRASILRELYKCHLELDNKEEAHAFLKKSEQVEIDYLSQNPLTVAAHLSLVETYELMEDADKVAEHIRASLIIAKLKVKKAPDSASAAYWLGRAEEKNGNLATALQEYQRASELDPARLKYRKAALSLSRKVQQ